MNVYYSFDSWDNELYHSGVPGMRWGIRRYQNKDGSLTELGKVHYGIGSTRELSEKGSKRLYKDLRYIGKSKRSEYLRNKYTNIDLPLRQVIADRRIRKIRNSIRYLPTDSMRSKNSKIDILSKQVEGYDNKSRLFNSRKVNKTYKTYLSAVSDVEHEARTYANDLLGKYANKKIYNIAGTRKITAAENLVRELLYAS